MGRVGFEPTMPEGFRFTVERDTPTSAAFPDLFFTGCRLQNKKSSAGFSCILFHVAEKEGLEPPQVLPRLFSRQLPYQLGYFSVIGPPGRIRTCTARGLNP